jgi:hypothetical protein
MLEDRVFQPDLREDAMTEAPVGPLRRRMIEDMTIRKFAPRTQEGYIRAIKGFSAFLGASGNRCARKLCYIYPKVVGPLGADPPPVLRRWARA